MTETIIFVPGASERLKLYFQEVTPKLKVWRQAMIKTCGTCQWWDDNGVCNNCWAGQVCAMGGALWRKTAVRGASTTGAWNSYEGARCCHYILVEHRMRARDGELCLSRRERVVKGE